MRLNIDLNPQLSARLTETARRRGIEPAALVENLVESLPPIEPSSTKVKTPAISAKNAAAIAYLDRRLKEEATDDPEEIRKADEEVAELKRNLNANRAATGERHVFS